jgi:hypothetical protein
LTEGWALEFGRSWSGSSPELQVGKGNGSGGDKLQFLLTSSAAAPNPDNGAGRMTDPGQKPAHLTQQPQPS